MTTQHLTTTDHEIDHINVKRASGLNPNNEPLYRCIQCLEHKTQLGFRVNDNGKLHDRCIRCEEKNGAVVAQKRHRQVKDRSHITVTEKLCVACDCLLSSDAFSLDHTQKDGLDYRCIECKRQGKSRLAKHANANSGVYEKTNAYLKQRVHELETQLQEQRMMPTVADAVVADVVASLHEQLSAADDAVFRSIQTQLSDIEERLTTIEAKLDTLNDARLPRVAKRAAMEGLNRSAGMLWSAVEMLESQLNGEDAE